MVVLVVIRRKRLWWLALGSLMILTAGIASILPDYLHPTCRPVASPRLVVQTLKGPQPIYQAHTTEKAIALTFDISWGEKMAPLVLDVLRQHQVKATFFLSGPWAKNHPEIVARIMVDGHDIQSHGHRHDNFSGLSKAQIVENIATAHAILKELTGKEPSLIRPPNGDYNELSVATAAELGYKTIIWSVDSLDWKNPGVDYMINRVLTKAHPGAIVLLHASDSPKQTHLALPSIIQGLQAQGYRLITLTELLKLDRSQQPPRLNEGLPQG